VNNNNCFLLRMSSSSDYSSYSSSRSAPAVQVPNPYFPNGVGVPPSGMSFPGPANEGQLAPMTEQVLPKPEAPVVDKKYTLVYNPEATVKICDWVTNLTGCADKDLLKPDVRADVIRLKEMVEVPGLPLKVPHLLVHNRMTQIDSDAGSIVVASIDDLQRAAMTVAREDEATPVKKPTLFIDMRGDSESLRCVDVSVLQCAKENEGCMFQAASNFNGVECISEHSTPDSPNFTTNYYYDHTQGPAASISAGSAAITRVHAAFYDAGKNPKEWGQTSKHQVEMLGDVSEYYSVTNGYVCNTKNNTLLPLDNPEAMKQIEGRVKVLLHANVDAMYGQFDYDSIDYCAPQKICQTFCAAMNLQQGMSGMRNRQYPDSPEKARLLLRAAYRGTYYGAEMYGCKKIFLTLIGGGVFGNDQGDIMEAICSTHEEICQFNKCIEEVHVVFFRPPPLNFVRDIITRHPIIPWKFLRFTRCVPTVIASSDEKM